MPKTKSHVKTKEMIESILDDMVESYHSEQLVIAEHVQTIMDQLEEDKDPLICTIETVEELQDICSELLKDLRKL